MNKFSEQENILITGASSGIGAETVLGLNARGLKVVGIARRTAKLEELKQKCSFPENFSYITVDLSQNLENIEDIIDEASQKYGKFSGFVHCAGVLNVEPLKIWNYQNALKDFNINLFSAVEIIKAISKKKNRQEFLNIVLTSSIAAKVGNPGAITYAMTKSALNSLVVSLSKEIGNKNIRLNSVMPGFLKTELTDNYTKILGYDCVEASREKTITGQSAKPEYISDLIAFLLSKESYWIQGQNICIDGGETL